MKTRKHSLTSALTGALITLAAANAPAMAHAQAQRPDIAAQFSGPAEMAPGFADHYRLTITNQGSAVAPSVSTVLTLPPGFALDQRIDGFGRLVFKVPANCTYQNGSTTKTVTCAASNVAVGESRTTVIDLRGPQSGSMQAHFTAVATAGGDIHTANNTAQFNTLVASFAPNPGFQLPMPVSIWTAIGRQSLMDNPMTQPNATFALDAQGEGNILTSAHAVVTKVGNGVNVKVYSLSTGALSSEWNLQPFSSRCWQGLGYWVTQMGDSDEVRMCY